jgi:hypothetical protein
MGPGGPGTGPGGDGPSGLLPGIRRLLGLDNDDEDTPLVAEVVVEYRKYAKGERPTLPLRGEQGQIFQYPKMRHKWGETAVAPNGRLKDIRLEIVQESKVDLPPVAQRYKAQRKEKLSGGKTSGGLLELAEWALNHAMRDEFAKIMDELREVEPSNPSLQAFDKMHEGMSARISQDDVAIDWQNRLGNYKVKKSPHYVLLYNSPENEPAEVQEYLERLEDNYRSFFDWFALKAKVLPVPTRRLVAVLVNRPDEFRSYRHVFDEAPTAADGFFARRENLAVFSSQRLDEAFDLLTKITNPLWQSGWNMDSLLQAKGHEGAQPDEVVRNQILALMVKAMQEESSLASVSHEGSIQLAVATGLLARNVEIPEWAPFGLGSFFETPKGAFWPGVGAPHWTYMVKFKVWKDNKKLDSAPEAIRKVITNQYFREATGEESKHPLMKARTMSWALTFFLMNRKLDQLLGFYQELDKLPRDLDFDDHTLLLAFARAFDLLDVSNPDRVDGLKLDKLAAEWYSYIELTPIESSEALQDAVNQYKKQQEKKGPKPTKAPNLPTPKITLPKPGKPK